MVQYFNLHVIDTFSIVDIVEVIDADIYGYRWMGLGWLDICETYKFFQIYNLRWMYDYGWDWDRNRYRWVLITYFTLWVKFHISTGACKRACIFVEMFANSIEGEDFSAAAS